MNLRDLAKDYDPSFYAMHHAWQPEYDAMADLLRDNLPPFKSVLDLGCGNGYLITALERTGCSVVGVDGSSNVLKYRPDIIVADLTKQLTIGDNLYDLVICTEVAEHIEERYADVLVDNVCDVALSTVFFSAAKAGFGGHLHVNEQERPYWYAKFTSRGFEIDHGMSESICSQLRVKNTRTWWFANNCFVVRRA